MKAILFDVDDTLYDQMEPFQNAYDEVFGTEHDLDMHKLYMANRMYSDEVFNRAVNGEMGMEEMHIYRISRAFEDFGITITKEQALKFQHCYARNQKYIQMTEGMEEILSYCHGKHVLMGVITNGPSAHQWNKVRKLGVERWIPKEHIIVSGDVGTAKPDPGIFLHAQKVMGLIKEQTWFVGDTLTSDVAGTKAAGWHSVWLNRRRYPLPEDMPDYLAQDEAGILEIIKEIVES